MLPRPLATLFAIGLMSASPAPAQDAVSSPQSLPRTAEGKPDLEGIWQAVSTADAGLEDHAASWNMLAGRSVVVGGTIPDQIVPYQPWAAAKKAQNFKNRATADPLSKCYMPGVPRIMYLDFPFQILQTPQLITFAFEWSLDYRLVYTDGSRHPEEVTAWMGDSRGRWEGDTLVVDVANNNDETWFDSAGDFHSDALHVVERYRMTTPDTIQFEATIEDPKVFTKPWTIRVLLQRRADRDRLFEYVCQDEVEEANGAFERETRTWYPGDGTHPAATPITAPPAPSAPVAANIHRKPDGKPDFTGYFVPDAGGANFGLERHADNGLTPPGRGVIIDPPDGKLPTQPWTVQEKADRNRPERGYDDPTAHCFPAGVPRAMYVPTSFELVQTSDYLVILHERIAWRIIDLHAREHLPDNMRLWQGDSIGHWEGDSLIVDTTNLNGKEWLNEVGEVISYAAHVIERFTPAGPNTINYEATVADPVVYTRPWTIAFPFRRNSTMLMEGACHEEDHDLPHLKAVKDAAAKKKP